MAGGRVRVQNNGEQLIISAVHRADKGVYQCMARNERDSAQASAELRLGGEWLKYIAHSKGSTARSKKSNDGSHSLS